LIAGCRADGDGPAWVSTRGSLTGLCTVRHVYVPMPVPLPILGLYRRTQSPN